MCIDVKVRVGTLLLVLDGKTRGFFLSGMTLPESFFAGRRKRDLGEHSNLHNCNSLLN